ncbi:hypothetical protein [Klebsiella pneumoniae]
MVEVKVAWWIKIDTILLDQGIDVESLYIPSSETKRDHYPYPDYVCMAILQYYAFDASQANNATALRNYRLLARQTLREFIFRSVGIDPRNPVSRTYGSASKRE